MKTIFKLIIGIITCIFTITILKHFNHFDAICHYLSWSMGVVLMGIFRSIDD